MSFETILTSLSLGYPFLDETFMHYINDLPIAYKCDPRLPLGSGDKRLLRAVASHCFHLHRTAARPKRAIQFGAKTAKMTLSSRHERGTMRVT